MDQMIYRREHNKKTFNKCEQLIIIEIGCDAISSASSFTNYISEIYGFSKSTVWYNLKNLKNKHILDFATKINPKQILSLTKNGVKYLDSLQKEKLSIMSYFNSRCIKYEQKNNFKYYDEKKISINIPLT